MQDAAGGIDAHLDLGICSISQYLLNVLLDSLISYSHRSLKT